MATESPSISVERHPRGDWIVLEIDRYRNRTVKARCATEAEAIAHAERMVRDAE